MEPVEGHAVIRFADVFLARWHASGKYVVPLVGLACGAYAFYDLPRGLPGRFDIIVIAAVTLMVMVILFCLIMFVGMVALSFLFFLPLNRLQRTIDYHVASDGLRLTDGRGLSLFMPWSAVRRTRETRRAFLLRIRPLSVRYLPLRAFAPADLPRLRALLREVLRDRARIGA
ncbi:MAG TPA: YcxB family protein [Rhizomicrobium sp.]